MNQQSTAAVHAALGPAPSLETITRLLADLIVYCRDRGIRMEALIADAVLIAAKE